MAFGSIAEFVKSTEGVLKGGQLIKKQYNDSLDRRGFPQWENLDKYYKKYPRQIKAAVVVREIEYNGDTGAFKEDAKKGEAPEPKIIKGTYEIYTGWWWLLYIKSLEEYEKQHGEIESSDIPLKITRSFSPDMDKTERRKTLLKIISDIDAGEYDPRR